MTDFTFFILKPDTLERNLIPEVLHRIQIGGMRFRNLRTTRASSELAAAHYAEHRDKEFFAKTVESLCDGPVLIGIAYYPLAAGDSVARLRSLIGPSQSPLRGTIRGDLMLPGDSAFKNLIHASDSSAAAIRESELWLGRGGEKDLR